MVRSKRLIIRQVTVVDTRDGSLTSPCDVMVDDGRIVAISSTPVPAVDESATLVDGVGKFLVPGFLDMHAHCLEDKEPDGALALMLANGVTGFRQMSGSDRLLQQRRDGTLPIPAASPDVLAMPGDLLTPVNARTEKDAVAAVRHQHEAGADFIKAALVGTVPFSRPRPRPDGSTYRSSVTSRPASTLSPRPRVG